MLTTPSFGTIKPALNRLTKSGCIKTQKAMSSGGRPSTYYSISREGVERMIGYLLEQPLDNPINFLPTARVKVACAEILDTNEQVELFKVLKLKSESISLDIKKLLDTNDLDYYKRMVFDNLICEYKNFISLLEGLIRAGKN